MLYLLLNANLHLLVRRCAILYCRRILADSGTTAGRVFDYFLIQEHKVHFQLLCQWQSSTGAHEPNKTSVKLPLER